MTTKDNVLIGIITRRLAESEAARNRQEHEDAAWLALNDYRETLADALARTGRV